MNFTNNPILDKKLSWEEFQELLRTHWKEDLPAFDVIHKMLKDILDEDDKQTPDFEDEPSPWDEDQIIRDDPEHLLDLLYDDNKEEEDDDEEEEYEEAVAAEEEGPKESPFETIVNSILRNTQKTHADKLYTIHSDQDEFTITLNNDETSQNGIIVSSDTSLLTSYHSFMHLTFLHHFDNPEYFFPLKFVCEYSFNRQDAKQVWSETISTPQMYDDYHLCMPSSVVFAESSIENPENEGRISIKVYDRDEHLVGIENWNVYHGMPSDHLTFESVSLQNSNAEFPRQSLMAFDTNTLGQLIVFSHLKSKDSDKNYDFQFTCRLYDEVGRLLEETNFQDSGDSSNVYDYKDKIICCAYFGKFNNYKWIKGNYRVEFLLWNVTVYSVNFHIGDRELVGEFDPIAIQNRQNEVGKKVIRQNANARQKLDQLIGLKSVKEQIYKLEEMNALATKRQELGLSTQRQALHAVFMGNPGTGKTTVATLIGKIYKEMGLLSKGHVVFEERTTLLGRYYDSELREIERALQNAQGGILFIDEAYSLYVKDDAKDPGHKVLEALLTALSDETNRDWMLVLAGYSQQMDEMLHSNPGLKSRISNVFHFDDYTVDELIEIADLYCRQNEYVMTPMAHKYLESVVKSAVSIKDPTFGNGRYIKNLLEQTIIPRMAKRVGKIPKPSVLQLQMIEEEDIGKLPQNPNSDGWTRLKGMIGMTELKESIESHLNLVKMINMRMEEGIHTQMPPLHMIFEGNPGTGKTTVANLMGEIYASMGILSKGDVICTEKSNLVGTHLGETEEKINNILHLAKGNVLFIDEAYQLYSEKDNDFGPIVLETLLTTLSHEACDMIVILAGYTKEMEQLLQSNPGLRSRFPFTFHFQDYSNDDLMEIAHYTVEKEGFSLSPKAKTELKKVIENATQHPTESFGNARFVTRLISTQILPKMASRLSKMKRKPTKRQLTTILAEDICTIQDPTSKKARFDEQAIDQALGKLDAMIGLHKVKTAIHHFVDIARNRASKNDGRIDDSMLKWSFVGNTGTGKSSVAKIMAQILTAMGVLSKGNLVEVKAEQIFNIPEFRCDEILKQAMTESKYGLLFIDGDAPIFKNMVQDGVSSEQLRIKLSSLTAEIGGKGALIVAECSSQRQNMVHSLAQCGIYDFDHTLIFDDYTAEELFQILCACLNKKNIQFAPKAAQKMQQYLVDLHQNQNLAFANARTMKLLSETLINQMDLRESHEKDSPRNQIQYEDVETFEWHRPYRKIGF